jgi:hypothetical protein
VQPQQERRSGGGRNDKKDVFYDLVRSGKSDASIKTRSHGMKISQVLRYSAVRPGQGVFIEQENQNALVQDRTYYTSPLINKHHTA